MNNDNIWINDKTFDTGTEYPQCCAGVEFKCTARNGAAKQQTYLYNIRHFEHNIVLYILHI